MRIWIILLIWNNVRDTLECLASLSKLTYSDHEILVVDNGSDQPILPEIKRNFPHIHILENGENLGYAEGNNRGIKYALKHGADALLLLNNDTTVDPFLLNALSHRFHPKTIFGVKIYRYDKPSHFDHLGGNWNPKKLQFDLVGLNQIDDGSWNDSIQVDYICGCALFASAAAFLEIGFFEPQFFLFWEESDWCFRARKKGYLCRLCPEAKIWHKGSASFIGGRPHTTYFWWRNRLLWCERNSPRKWKIILPEILNIYKRKWIHAIKIFNCQIFKKSSLQKNREKFLQYQAASLGIRHYFKRRFGNAPKKIFKPK